MKLGFNRLSPNRQTDSLEIYSPIVQHGARTKIDLICSVRGTESIDVYSSSDSCLCIYLRVTVTKREET